MTATFVPDPDEFTPGADRVGPHLPIRQPLTRRACLALLEPGGHGRVAATMRAIPVIIPVSFALIGEDVAFTPGGGAGLAQAMENAVVAFEADQAGPDGHTAWEVHVTGVARRVCGGADKPGFQLASHVITGSRAAS